MFELIFALTLIGALLLFIEIFVPGMVAGILGGFLLLAGIVVTYANYGFEAGNWLLLCELVFGGALFLWWMRSFSESRLGRECTLQEAVPNDPAEALYGRFEGCAGKALTALRPSGTALIEGQRIDVIAQSEMIEAGAALRVIRVEGSKVVVRRE
ncbi:MAG: NfeD family protein [Verrucomicrobiota bacterium]